MLDPTPCPASRYGVSHTSLLGDQDPSVTLPRIGLRDAKPRRPLRRESQAPQQSDVTVDICDDTFQLRKLPPPPSSRPSVLAPFEPDPSAALSAIKSSRRSTIFAQPAQRPSISTHSEGRSLATMAPSAHKRRLSSVIGHQAPTQSEEPSVKQPVEGPTISKEARRRTIYVPSDDTTMFTIHPGRSLQSRDPRPPRKTRKSDIFLDILDEEAESQPAPVFQPEPVKSFPVRRPARQSLLVAPRRAPLQATAQPPQANGNLEDRNGRGDGKENVPPSHGSEVKRLGKRASLLITDKKLHDQPSSLDALPEGQEAPVLSRRRPSLMPVDQARQANQGRKPRESLGIQARRSSIMLKPRESVLPRDVQLGATVSTSMTDTPAVASFRPTPMLAKYPVITEDISSPSMYEDNWLQHQEQSMTQLINSLFEQANGKTPSALSLAEHIALRQDMLKLYQNTDTAYMHKRLQASLQFGALNVPSETLAQVARFKDDFGQRQRFIDLWVKTYNVEALQTAAEVVVGRQRSTSPRTSSSSPAKANTKSTALFLRTFLVMNEDAAIDEGLAKAKQGLDTASGWRRTAMRSLMLIHLLDHSQESGLLKGCLFQPTSPYKSSLAVLQGLCRLLIPSVGDVSRTLHHLGYSVSHIQQPLSECDFQISNLATDLRDGIRITRLVEILFYSSPSTSSPDSTLTLPTGTILPLSLSQPLSQHLKHPALCRAQKIHNSSIALAALAASKSTAALLADMRPEDLVDGHREKTIRLLWGLVSRWGVEYLVDFTLVRREIARLRRGTSLPIASADSDPDSEAHIRLLHTWSAAAASQYNLPVPNLSTSFADGRVAAAILSTYAPLLPGYTPPPPSDGSMPQLTLASLGCSNAFQALFPIPSPSTSSTKAARLPTRRDVIPLLTFLAARLLPAIQPCLAARSIQRAWRGWSGRRRAVCKRLACEARAVVLARERIEWAARVLQRRWRGAHWL